MKHPLKTALLLGALMGVGVHGDPRASSGSTVSEPSMSFAASERFLRNALLLALAFGLAACEPPPVNRDSTKPLTTVERVDVDRYLGRWYEIARYDHSFERGCFAVTATYSKNADGSIKVVNRCREGALDGPEDVADGSATIADPTTNAKLAVTFFWPFSGDYWIIGLADDYSWALVGEPSGRYLWILARTPQIAPELRADLVAKLQAKGYNSDALIWVQQPEN